MKASKKILGVAVAGAMVCAALTLTGCFGFGGNSGNSGSGSGGSTGGNTGGTPSAMVGTWELAAAMDMYGEDYDIDAIGADAVVLTVFSNEEGVFNYFDDPAYQGKLTRDKSRDSYYAADGYTTQAWRLTGEEGNYWEFAFITSTDGDAFFYLEVGPEGEEDSIFLSKR